MRAGTQLYVRDLSLSLRALGHEPIVYAPILGTVATELEDAGVRVVDDLDKLDAPPDIIHGNQAIETIVALLFFPQTPGVYFCHSWVARLEVPPLFPRIQRYVAVDEPCYEYLLASGVTKENTRVILNFVDLARFKQRCPLPERPRRALVFSNYANAQSNLKTIREACSRNAIDVDAFGEGVGYVEKKPEMKLGEYDVVFAKGRAALEAMAVGAAVILCDVWGVGPMVSVGEFDHLRRLNFGRRTLQDEVTVEAIQKQMDRYDSRDAAEVSRRIRANAGIDAATALVLDVYEEAIADYKRHKPMLDEEGRAAARFILSRDAHHASHIALTLRLRNRLLRIPIIGPGVVWLREWQRASRVL